MESRNIVDDSGTVIGYMLDEQGNPPAQPSKYDPPIDDFLRGDKDMQEIHHKKPAYLRTQLNRRIRARGLERVFATVIGGKVYLRRRPMPSTQVYIA